MSFSKREDYNLGFLLKYENVAWFDDEKKEVRILDRRIYPIRTEYVVCKEYTQVVQAVADMVTQSGGPFSAAAMGMVLAANQFKNLAEKEFKLKMEEAALDLSSARPTTKAAMQCCTSESLNLFYKLIEEKASSGDIIKKLKENAVEQNNRRYKKNTSAGAVLAKIVRDGSSILTQCFGETVIGGFLRSIIEEKKHIKLICTETRPFLQGARLTASLAQSMDIDTYVITDNMPAVLMTQNRIDYFISASDIITMDGYIVNKTGTLQIALAAHHFGIPYYAAGFPDKSHPDSSSVHIEFREAEDVVNFFNTRVTVQGIKAFYPAFDITPPELCTGIVTDKRIYPPPLISSYFEDAEYSSVN